MCRGLSCVCWVVCVCFVFSVCCVCVVVVGFVMCAFGLFCCGAYDVVCGVVVSWCLVM